MKKESGNEKLWNLYAKFYDAEVLRFSDTAYKQMYQLMGDCLSNDMRVLEIATGTGLIAANIACFVQSVEATDFAPKMIETAKRKAVPSNVHFTVADAMALSFTDHAFDAVIISNALHIMPDPQKVLAEVHRVLKPSGLLIAPCFSHGHLKNGAWNLNAALLKLVGFQTYSKWLPQEYVEYIHQNGFTISNWRVLQAAFPLVYVEAVADNT